MLKLKKLFNREADLLLPYLCIKRSLKQLAKSCKLTQVILKQLRNKLLLSERKIESV
jgi:hypothetical protein